MNKELFESIKEYFKKNANVNKVYVTTDGCIFSAKHYADNWSISLPNDKKAITEVTRAEALGLEETAPADVKKNSDTKAVKTAADTGGGDDEKEALRRRYVELYDKNPNHMLGIPKLKAAIEEKEAEIKKSAETEAAKKAQEGGDQQ